LRQSTERRQQKRRIQVASRSAGVSNTNSMVEMKTSLPSIKSKAKIVSDANIVAEQPLEQQQTGSPLEMTEKKNNHQPQIEELTKPMFVQCCEHREHRLR
jgi:hypothetical protein